MARKQKSEPEELCQVKVVHWERVEAAHQAAPKEHELARLAAMYKAMGDVSRLKLVAALAEQELCVCDLAAFGGLSQSAVSHSLRRLKDMGLVKCRREGKMLFYSLDDEHVSGLLDLGLSHVREK